MPNLSDIVDVAESLEGKAVLPVVRLPPVGRSRKSLPGREKAQRAQRRRARKEKRPGSAPYTCLIPQDSHV